MPPFCSAYVRFTALRAAAGPVELIDARSEHPALREIRQAGLDINQGMVAKFQGRLYHGADAMHVLSLMTTNSSFFNRAMRLMLAHRTAALVLYPVLRAGRNLTLRLLGRKRIDWETAAAQSPSQSRPL